ncbi:hypothetical protein COOONC_00082 [Cooperia oncophora]
MERPSTILKSARLPVSKESSQGKESSKRESCSSPHSPSRRRTSKDLEQGPDESTRTTKPGTRERRKKLREDSIRKLKEGRRKILELAQQLRKREGLGRTHSDPSLNIKKDKEQSGESTRKSKSMESTTQDKTSAAVVTGMNKLNNLTRIANNEDERQR